MSLYTKHDVSQIAHTRVEINLPFFTVCLSPLRTPNAGYTRSAVADATPTNATCVADASV